MVTETQPARPRFNYPAYFREMKLLHDLQTTPEERTWLLEAPKPPVRPAQVVLYLGGNVLRQSHLVRTVVDIFRLLRVDFVAVGGVAYCCGVIHHRNGDKEAGVAMARASLRHMQRFQPERIVMWCPGCIFVYGDLLGLRGAFPFQHVAEFLVERLDQLPFKQEVLARVAFHCHTGRPQTDTEARCARTLLAAIPGLRLMDLGADPRLGRQCSGFVRQELGPQRWDDLIASSFQKAVTSGAEIYATLYHGCQRSLCLYEKKYPIKVEHYLTLLGRALGIEHEDRFKKYALLADAQAIWDDVRPYAQANGVSAEEAQAVIHKNFIEGNIW